MEIYRKNIVSEYMYTRALRQTIYESAHKYTYIPLGSTKEKNYYVHICIYMRVHTSFIHNSGNRQTCIRILTSKVAFTIIGINI